MTIRILYPVDRRLDGIADRVLLLARNRARHDPSARAGVVLPQAPWLVRT